MKKILIFLCFLLILFNSDIIHSKVIPPKPKPNEYIDKSNQNTKKSKIDTNKDFNAKIKKLNKEFVNCLLYTSPSPRDRQKSRMPSSA